MLMRALRKVSVSLKPGLLMKWRVTGKNGMMLDAQSAMRVIEEPGVDSEARSIRKAGKPVFGYKQHTVVDNNGLVMAATTTAANCHDSKPLLGPRQSQYPVSSRNPRSYRQGI